ncbi:MAG: IS982 family transposase [Chlamydiales bacterium]
MESFAATVYVITDEILKILNIQEDEQALMSNAEVMTFAILAAKYFHGNFKMARYICKKIQLFPFILSNSRLNRRIHAIQWNCWQATFRFLSFIFMQSNENHYFAVDSFPVICCQKNRIDKRKLFPARGYLGFAASKKRYFCGIKVHMLVTCDGKPIEIHFKPGSIADVNVLWEMELNIPGDSIIYADGAYNSFDLEDVLKEEGIQLLAKRGIRAKQRTRSASKEKEISSRRQIIETAFSCITNLFPRYLKVRTEAGFMIKVMYAVLAYCTSFLCRSSLA